MQTKRLEAIAAHLAKELPPFEWQIMTKAEVEERGILDPACALIRGRFGPFEIDLHEDGEGCASWGGFMEPFDSIDMVQKPALIAQALRQKVSGMKPRPY